MNDLISRREAFDMIMNQPPKAHYPSWYAERIMALPPIKQERACEYWDAESKFCTLSRPSALHEHDKLHPKADPNFKSCFSCVHFEDSDEICILRRCMHAIAQLKECYTER